MKPETNNEMDLLLRRLGRSAADSHENGDHLDADELSSYAENALPAPVRARYTEHLAECASCRKLVTQLSSSAGVVSVAETAKVSEPSALRKFLASLFSPMVLRYAVPALGLIVVAAIGFTVLRNDQRADSVAQLTQQEGKAPTAQSEPVQSPEPGVFSVDREKAGSTAATADNRGQRSKETQPAPPPNASASGRVAEDADQAAPVTKPEEQPAANTAPQPTPVTATDEIKKRDESEAAKKEVAVRGVSDLQRERAAEPPKREDSRTHGFMAAQSPAPAAAGARKAQGAGSVANLQRDGAEEKDKNDAETRSVAGRRFRREHGMWIDTAYAAPRTTVSVSRGSEQYRALVADEPGIKTIAEELDGEIIVVWKGRAYRIR